ncbi:NmrA family NAD(P)-binding protein [candidate division KSB1 bacterium]|nr:NmrA family NAD(P)-binding protein [candidate division KSB1 bacterium]
MILITGATGNIGGRLAKRLLDDGEQIRVVSRKTEKLAELVGLGAEPMVGDLLDPDFVGGALDGCEKAFLVVQGNVRNGQHYEEELQVGENFANSLKSAGISHLIFSGSMGADKSTGSPIIEAKGEIEKMLKETGVPATVLRPGNFFENMFNFLETISSGFFTYPLDGGVKVPYVSVDDIARIAYKALKRGPKGWEVYDLAGAEDYSMRDIAVALSDKLNRMIKYVRIADDQFVEVFTGFGISEKFCEDMLAMFRFFERAEFDYDREIVAGEFDYQPMTMKQFLPKLVKMIK